MRTYTKVQTPRLPQSEHAPAKGSLAPPNSALEAMAQLPQDALADALSSLPQTPCTLPDHIASAITDRLGVAPDSVRVTEDEGLAELGQPAYAKGDEIHVAKGHFAPSTPAGERLILHEAAHVAQQGRGLGKSGGAFLDSPALEGQANAVMNGGGLSDAGSIAAPVTPVAASAAPAMGFNPFKAIWGGFKNVGRRMTRWSDNLYNRKQAGEKLSIGDKIGYAISYPFRNVDNVQRRNAHLADLDDYARALRTAYDPDALGFTDIRDDVDESAFSPEDNPYLNAGQPAKGVQYDSGIANPIAAGMKKVSMLGSVAKLGAAGASAVNKVKSFIPAEVASYIGPAGNVLGAGGKLAGGIGSIAKTVTQAKQGDRASAAQNGLDAVSSLTSAASGALSGLSFFAPALMAGVPGSVVPGLNIAAGGVKMISGGVGIISQGSRRAAMTRRLNELEGRDDPEAETQKKLFKQFRSAAKIDQTESGFKLGSGALGATAGALTLSGVGLPVATGLAVASGLTTVASGVVSGKMHKSLATDTVNTDLNLPARIADAKQRFGIDDRDAKHVVLRAMGFHSGKRKEAFQSMTVNRAAKLHRQASDPADPQHALAVGILKDMGIRAVGGGYNLQGIVEKLGMTKGTDWRKQLQATQRSRRYAAL